MKTQILIPVLMFLGLSCSLSPIGPSVPPATIFPLASGNEWRFTLTHVDTNGVPTQSRIESLLVLQDTVLAGEHWSLVWLYGDVQALRNSYSGVQSRLLDNPTTGVLFKYPTFVGDSVAFPIPVHGGGLPHRLDLTRMHCKVMSLDTVVTVPAGTFKCVQYRTAHNGRPYSYSDIFVSPGIGWVKETSYSVQFFSDPTMYLRSIKVLDTLITN